MNWLPFELLFAFRYLKPKRTYVSVVTLICIMGVMLGVAVLMVVIAVMTGFDEQLRDKLVAFNAHLRIENSSGPMREWESILKEVCFMPNVRGAAPYVVGQIMVKTQPSQGPAKYFVPIMKGIEPTNEVTVSEVLSHIVAGTADFRGYGVLVGRQLAQALGVWVGDTVAVYSIKQFEEWDRARAASREEVPLPNELEVRGIFEIGFYEFDSMFMLCSLPDAQELVGLQDSVHGILVKLDRPELAAVVADQIRQRIGPTYVVRTWMEENSTLLEALAVEKHVMFYLLFFITVVAAFGICSALITFVVQKTREIGTLKALGATNLQVMTIFLSQSLLVGIAGVSLGYVLGSISLAYRNDVLRFLRRVTGFELFPASIYSFSELPAKVVGSDVLVIIGASLLICLLAGLIPARHAARMQPVEALRHE